MTGAIDPFDESCGRGDEEEVREELDTQRKSARRESRPAEIPLGRL
jgi:hypothetical protein